MLHEIEADGHIDNAVKILRWLCLSSRPLRVSEVVEILAVDNGDEGGFSPDERPPDPADVIAVCSSLISCHPNSDDDDGSDDDDDEDNWFHDSDSSAGQPEDEAEAEAEADENVFEGQITDGRIAGIAGDHTACYPGVIRLAHFSVKEYLLSDRCRLHAHFRSSSSHQQMAEECLHYLLYAAEQRTTAESVTLEYPLLQYAAAHWWQHARNAEDDHEEPQNSTTVRLAVRLLESSARSSLSAVRWPYPDRLDQSASLWASGTYEPALHYAALIGLPVVVEAVLNKGADVNEKGGQFYDALQAASNNGYQKVVQILLDHKADANGQLDRGGPLREASSNGHEAVVRMLLAAGADVNARRVYYHHAVRLAPADLKAKPNIETMQRSLVRFMRLDALSGRTGITALMAAAQHGHKKVVQMLLDNKAEVNAQDESLGSALQAASSNGFLDVVQILLKAGAKVDAQCGHSGNALQAASSYGSMDVAQLLLDAGADVNARTGNGDDNDHEDIFDDTVDAYKQHRVRGGWR